MNYCISPDEFLTLVENKELQGKKVLFSFGDSWTHNSYLDVYGTYPQKCWSYQLAEKLGYDWVINISTMGGSNEEIFQFCVNTMCLYDGYYDFEKCRIHEIGAEEIKVVIGWSSQLRNYDALNSLFRPYIVSSFAHVNAHDTPFQNLYRTYLSHLHNEYYSFKTQMQTIALQHYFKHHGIEFFAFMAFTPLLEEELMGTKWDLRQDIDEKRFYKLFQKTNSMCSTLNEFCNDTVTHEYIIETPMLYTKNIRNYFSTFTNGLKAINRKYLSGSLTPDSRYFISDGHPNEAGLEVISNELYNLINRVNT